MVQICRKHLLNRKFLQVGRIATGENCASAARMTLESGETSACTANEVILVGSVGHSCIFLYRTASIQGLLHV